MTQDPTVLDLRGLADPTPISLTPQTWGWYVLIVAALALISLCGWRAIRHYVANRYRRAALAELHTTADVESIALLVKRVCLTAFPRSEVAALSGDDYLQFLDSTTGGNSFTSGPGRALGDHYGKSRIADDDLTSTVDHWIRKHRARA